MRRLPESILDDDQHQDFQLLSTLRDLIFEASGGEAHFSNAIPTLLRDAIDEVIDTPRTARIRLDELEKTEKTYIGTKVEIVIRDFLKFPKGRLDFIIGGHDVDVKNTVKDGWMIPQEAFGCPCILLAEDEDRGKCWFGLVVARPEYLRLGQNRDRKGSFSAEGLKNVLWLLFEEPFSQGFWYGKDPNTVAEIMDKQISGAQRIRRLFRSIQNTPISRDVVVGVARQLDPLKRVRGNGGARDQLAEEGIAILCGKWTGDVEAIKKLNLPECGHQDFISFAPSTESEFQILYEAGLKINSEA